MANQYLQNLIQKEVSRKEFLGMLGLAALSLFGSGTVLKLLTGKSLEGHHVADAANGFRSSFYGGTKQ
jgi:hypothetical protein